MTEIFSQDGAFHSSLLRFFSLGCDVAPAKIFLYNPPLCSYLFTDAGRNGFLRASLYGACKRSAALKIVCQSSFISETQTR